MTGGFIPLITCWNVSVPLFISQILNRGGLMELCTIEDAFPNIGGGKNDTPYAGGKDGYSSREERRAAKKLRAKRIKAEAEAQAVDPDRPAMERMD
jgi:hypothetical protein